MRKIISIFSICILFTSACKSQEKKAESDHNCPTQVTCKDSPLNALSAEEKEDGWVLLFDGKTSNGWRGFKKDEFPDKGWHVVDGTLMIEYSGTGEKGFAGDIITKDIFSNFDLKLEWKQSRGGNSGILINVNESDKYEASWHTAPEIQVLDDYGYDDVHDYNPTLKQISGALYDLYTPFTAASKPIGEWNKVRIRMEDGHLQHWLNGKIVVDTQLWTDDWDKRVAKSKFNIYPDFGKAKEGHIGLQDHGQQVWFRNIRIKKL